MTPLEIVIEAAERRVRELLNEASNYERLPGMQVLADETMRDHVRPLLDAIDHLRSGELFVVGNLDETEFMGQWPAMHGITATGPFWTLDEAIAAARLVSVDPTEGVVLPIVRPS